MTTTIRPKEKGRAGPNSVAQSAVRTIIVPESHAGMRLDRFLSKRFADRSRTWLANAIRAGGVVDTDGRVLSCSHRVVANQHLGVRIEGIGPTGEPPRMPPILFENDELAVVDKPAGMLSHPAGTRFEWALVSLAKRHWNNDDICLAHRLDRDTSGAIILSKTPRIDRQLKTIIKEGRLLKEYIAIVKGTVPWDVRDIDEPIGKANGPIRIQMGVAPDGLAAQTQVEVIERHDRQTLVRCRIRTGRTHQIRVHLAHIGHPLVGDRMYGVPPHVFLDVLDHGVRRQTMNDAGGPRQALHAAHVSCTLPDGTPLEAHSPLPDDMRRWWNQPDVLPFDGHYT